MSISLEAKRRALLEQKLRGLQATKVEDSTVTPVPREGRLPCSYQQEGLWILQQLDPDSSVYHVTYAMRLRGHLDVNALRAALTALAVRHESLRTRFGNADGVPYQIIDPMPAAFSLPMVELSSDAATEWVQAQCHRPFDLEAEPAFRASLARITPDEHVLLLVPHHIVIDGWSATIAAKELSELYNASRAGAAVTLPELTVQPVDYAVWQRRWLTGPQLESQIGYWRDTLDGIQDLEFPTDRPRPAQPTGAGALFSTRLPDELAPALRELARGEQASYLAVLLAAFLTVLNRYTGQQDLTVGSVFSGRTRSEIEPLVGFFANMLVLRTSLAGDVTFRELVGRCNDTVMSATAHQDVPFELVVDACRPERVPGRNPLFQISFGLQAAAVSGDGIAFDGLEVSQLDISEISWQRSRFDVHVGVAERADGGLDLQIEYSTELFDHERMERLIEHLRAVLTKVVADPDIGIRDIDVLSEAELATVVKDWNPAPVERAGGLLQDFVTRWAARTPSKPAMRFEGVELTYAELETRSNRLAHLLIDRFQVLPGQVVGMLLERGLDLQVAQLGVLKAGGAWMPVDPQHPVKRIAYQVHDANVPVVITTSDLADLLPPMVPMILLDKGESDQRVDTPPAVDIRPEDVAYVMYTSGSTGAPKGVMVPHRAAVQYALSTAELFSITPDDRLSQVANPAFDVSIFDTFAAFAAGATGIGAPRTTLLDPDALGALLRDERVTISYVPSALLSLVDPELPRDLRVMMVAGETCSAELANRWSRSGREFHNGYGPTEVTVTCTDYLCPPELLDKAPSIGRAMANQRAYVLDKRLRPAPIGVAGQLYMAGAGLARGYLGRPDLTADKFVPDPFSREPGERMYATGDLVRWRADGNLEFLGRLDRQVQLRGLRIELGEIEHAIAGYPGVRQSVVIVKDADTPEARLIGYLIPESGHQVDVDEVRQKLAEQLPLHMVPGDILTLSELPLTGNGKLDKDRLPDPEPESGVGYVPPGTNTERRLAEIWQVLLKLDAGRIGIGDNFFKLGGNSLQSTQLIARIRDQFMFTLHPRALFIHPTLGDLAERIDQEFETDLGTDESPENKAAEERERENDIDAHGTVSALVPIKTDGTRPPLFFVHAVGGSVAPYVALASLLGEDQPFYGLEDPGLHGGTAAVSLPAIAANYLGPIRDVQPDGPFHLGGWSFGGAVALEMARQLRAGGEEVAVVVALDSGVPDGLSEPDQAELLTWFVEDLAGLTGVDPPTLDQAALGELAEGTQVDVVLDTMAGAGLGSGWARDNLRNRINVFSANMRAFLAYQPDHYLGRLVLISAADSPDDNVERWHALATDGLEHHQVLGNHYTLLQEPHLTSVAEALRRCLDTQADAGAHADQ